MEFSVIKVLLPLPFRLNHIYAYLIRGSNGWTIIDTGLHRQETLNVWHNVLAKHNIKFTEIEQILITHYHPDHYGCAGALQQLSGAPVKMSAICKDYALSTWTDDNCNELRRFYGEHGMPQAKVEETIEHVRLFFAWVQPHPKQIEIIEINKSLLIGDEYFEVLQMPGHAKGHLVFYHKREKILFAGDTILARISPNISIMGFRDQNPLKEYVTTLKRLAELDVQIAYVGHGQPIRQLGERVRELCDHHQQRLQTISQLLGDGSTAFAIAEQLFPQNLSIHEFRFAIGEIVAHLEYGVELDIYYKCYYSGCYYYSLNREVDWEHLVLN